jgi:ABC-type Mn2+/Zn2+ transport system permease subunit
MIDFLWLPFTYGFMQRGFAAAVIVGALCALVGCYVVLRSMAFMGDAMAHAILPGIAIAYLLGGNLQVGALIAAIAVALGIGFFSQGGEIKEDTAIGILFSAALSLGVALISSIRTYAIDLSHILFGDVLGVSPANLRLIGGLAAAVILTVVIFYRPFLVITFDPVLAKTLRMPTGLLRNLLLVLLSVTIVISLQTVGIGLVAAMLVTPAAAAYMLTRRLPVMMAFSILFGVLSGIIGLYLSYYLNIASGASIVLVATLIFLVAYFFSPRGRIWRLVRSRN